MAAGARGVRLADVGDHHRTPRPRAEHSPRVDGSRVAASGRAEVHAPSRRHARHDVGRRYGAEEVPGTGGDEEADGPHEERIMRIRTLAGVAGVGALVWALVVRGSLVARSRRRSSVSAARADHRSHRRPARRRVRRRLDAVPREDASSAAREGRGARARRGPRSRRTSHARVRAHGDDGRDGPVRASRARPLPPRARPRPARRRDVHAH